ncbi:MAG: tryptophan--tRNA ligase [Myxococcales bacterium]|nr:MAG: tryptophan--tRNA ligase [Myxococcales bacterium]
MKKRLFSGMQPTGALHLGNWVGALQNWIGLLDQYDCIFCIVDYHAITIPYDVAGMERRIIDAASDYIAAGLDPARATIFVQSDVPQHTELAWVFDSVTPLGQLMRMTQFKAKTAQFADMEEEDEQVAGEEERSEFLEKAGKVNAGLFTYPVLQAADILLYKGEAVPVGEDQVQHVELTRDIARRFNNRYGEVFPECRPLLSPTPRLMGLDAVNKMSKSIGNHIPMQTPPEEIIRRVTREAVSDYRRQRRQDPGVPEECNVHAWHKVFSTPAEVEWSAQGCRSAGIGCFECKKKVAENIAGQLAPYREKRAEIAARPDYVRDVLAEGAKRCREIAAATMEEVRTKLGLTRGR